MDQPAERSTRYVADDHGDRGEVMLTASLFLAAHGAIWACIGAAVCWWFLKG